MKEIAFWILLLASFTASAQSKPKAQKTLIKISIDGKVKTIRADGKDIQTWIIRKGDTTHIQNGVITQPNSQADSLSAALQKAMRQTRALLERVGDKVEFGRIHEKYFTPDVFRYIKKYEDFFEEEEAHKKHKSLDNTESREVKLYEYSKKNPVFKAFDIAKAPDLEFKSLHYSTTSHGFEITFRTRKNPIHIALLSPTRETLYYKKEDPFDGEFDGHFVFKETRKGYYLFKVSQSKKFWVFQKKKFWVLLIHLK